MRVGWKEATFDEVFIDVTGGNKKTLQSEVLLSGTYPVVDQGRDLVAGYVNDADRLCKSNVPVIVFGDHTRRIKYVDFPFCIGADGTKILRLRHDGDLKYFFHYLRQLRIGGGYDRHFKFLRRQRVVVPPLADQRRIAEVLDRSDGLRAKRRAALAQLDHLTQSIFLDMFGDPLRNRMDFPQRAIGELLTIPPNFGTMIPPTPDGGKWLSIRVGNIQNHRLQLSDRKYVDLPAGALLRYGVEDGDLLMVRAIASLDHLGKSVVAHPGEEHWAFDSHLMRLRFDRSLAHPDYLHQLLITSGGRQLFLGASRRSAVQYNINTKEVSALMIPVPPIELQQQFASHAAQLGGTEALQIASSLRLERLFASLQRRAFRGEL